MRGSALLLRRIDAVSDSVGERDRNEGSVGFSLACLCRLSNDVGSEVDEVRVGSRVLWNNKLRWCHAPNIG